MKKFLSKLPIMITFVSVSVIMLIVYIGLLVRPIAVGFTYKGQNSSTVKYEFKIKSNNKLIATDINEEGTVSKERWYFVEDGHLYLIGNVDEMSEKEFESRKKAIIKDLKYYEEEYGIKTNAFVLSAGKETATCLGTILVATIGGVVTLALLTFGTLSVLYYVKGRKQA